MPVTIKNKMDEKNDNMRIQPQALEPGQVPLSSRRTTTQQTHATATATAEPSRENEQRIRNSLQATNTMNGLLPSMARLKRLEQVELTATTTRFETDNNENEQTSQLTTDETNNDDTSWMTRSWRQAKRTVAGSTLPYPSRHGASSATTQPNHLKERWFARRANVVQELGDPDKGMYNCIESQGFFFAVLPYC